MDEGILVPLDGSDAAEIVLPYVEQLSVKAGGRIILVSVSESGIHEMKRLYRSYLERVESEVQERLQQHWAAEAVKTEHHVLLGKPAQEILRYADKTDVKLIAMASRGSSGQGPWLLGTIAAKVLRATARPTLLIRTPAKEDALRQKRLVKKILMPLDGSETGEAAIPLTENLARALDAEIVLFQVIEPITTWAGFEGGVSYAMLEDEQSRKASALAYLEEVEKPLKEKGLSISKAVGFGSPASQIIDYAETHSIDLIAMSTHGRSGIGRWVFGSVTDKVLHTGDVGVLAVRAKKAQP